MAVCLRCGARYDDDAQTCAVDGSTLVADAVVAAADRDLERGEVVGEYRIEDKLGSGGFGSVYRAVHPLIGKRVAVKVLSRRFSSDPVMVTRFVDEARAVNQVHHKNIVDIFAFGALVDGRQYYVMELLQGCTFAALLEDRAPLPPAEALPILVGIARALDAAHEAGILHRDLKPENVFLVEDEDGVRPKLLDFGIAKLVGGDAAAPRTHTGVPIGTPHYMSPEQCRGAPDIDRRADVYALGVVAHVALTGRLPFGASNPLDILFQQVSEPPPRLSEHLPALGTALDDAVLTMLAKEPDRRPPTAGAAARALCEAAVAAGYAVQVPVVRSPSLGSPTTARDRQVIEAAETLAQAATGGPATLGGGLESRPGRSPRWPVVAALAAIATVGTGVAWVVGGGRPGRAPAEASTVAELPSAAASPPAPAPAASSAATLVPAPPASVALTIRATPPDAEVWLDGRRLGDARGPVALPRSPESVELELRAKGHVARKVAVVPSSDSTLSVKLDPVARERTPKELEF
ncbi:MAG: serine/threonine protein kinase [Polyangiaceae bacterium]|nr:serine/threonine protein kinase [Polyangiaceae bacterium]